MSVALAAPPNHIEISVSVPPARWDMPIWKDRNRSLIVRTDGRLLASMAMVWVEAPGTVVGTAIVVSAVAMTTVVRAFIRCVPVELNPVKRPGPLVLLPGRRYRLEHDKLESIRIEIGLHAIALARLYMVAPALHAGSLPITRVYTAADTNRTSFSESFSIRNNLW